MKAFAWWLAAFVASLPAALAHALAAPWRALLKAAPIKLWAMIGAGIAMTAMVAWQVRELRQDLRVSTSEAERLLIFSGFFNVIYAELFAIMLVIIALTGTIVKISAGKEGLRADVNHDDADEAADAPPAPPSTSTQHTSSGVTIAPTADMVEPAKPAPQPPAE